MKKIFVMILAAAVLIAAFAALAESVPQQGPGQGGAMGGPMIDFDAMVENGVISQETRDKIQAYMEAHRPDGDMPTAPIGGQGPADGQQPPEKPEGDMPADMPQMPGNDQGQAPDFAQMPGNGQGQMPDLLSELLSAEVITQAEYDALSAAIAAN